MNLRFQHLINKSQTYLGKAHLAGLFVLFSLVSYAQSPTHIPRNKPTPVNFFESVENIVFFIVIPVVIVILYILWRRRLGKEKKQNQE